MFDIRVFRSGFCGEKPFATWNLGECIRDKTNKSFRNNPSLSDEREKRNSPPELFFFAGVLGGGKLGGAKVFCEGVFEEIENLTSGLKRYKNLQQIEMSGNVNEAEKPSDCCIYRHFPQLEED